MISLKIKQLDRTFATAIVIVLLVCAYLAFSHISNKKRLFETEQSVLSSKMIEIDKAAKNLGTLQINLADIKKELSDLNERIPEAGKIGLLLKQIDALMKQHKVMLVSLEPMPASQDKIYLKNPIRLLFKGEFVNIVRLIRDLEAMNRIMIMENLIISKSESADQCEVELMTLVFERPKTT